MYFNSAFTGGMPSSSRPRFQPEPIAFPSGTDAGDNKITVLTSLDHPVNKRFFLDEHELVQKQNFQNAFHYAVTTVPVGGIRDLATLIEFCSADNRHILIRGLPVGTCRHRIQRTKENFVEPAEGTAWAMLDFDDVEVPEHLDPVSVEAIEWVIAKLPAEFRDVTYFYQYSASAGVLSAAGVPLKSGLNAHLFFWLDRRVSGKLLSAYLSLHGMKTGFYKLGENRGGNVDLSPGVDPAPLRSEVQPHFIAAPTIDAGVRCRITTDQRQGLIEKSKAAVTLPTIAAAVVQEAKALKDQLVGEYKRSHGYETHVSVTNVQGKVAVTRYSIAPRRADQPARSGRPFANAKLSPDAKYLTLYFTDEGSPGSWYVCKDRPQLGVRHGDGSAMPLKELSQGAHDYVRDELGWFTEVPHHHLSLVDGYLPPLAGFAAAKVSLILSPTCSGKTTATIGWIQDQIEQRRVVLYAGPTIALVDQMRDDLTVAGLNPVYYKDAWGPTVPRSGVIVTTYDSVSRLLKSIYDMGLPHVLILDEIHQGLDRCMESSQRLAGLESALGKARQTLLLTGTLTDVQRHAIVEVCKQALGSLTETDYCCYEFASSKANPLRLMPSDRFDLDLATLLEDFQGKLSRNEPLPRFVLLIDTSKMELYRLLMERYGLTEHALIVSRPESAEAEIEVARTSTLPILVASPLFGLGLNFEREPEIFWARFDHVGADTNQIIQTVNRANRGQVQCQVRIYGNVQPDVSFALPNQAVLRQEIAERLQGETSIAGLLEAHLHLDRVLYQELRKAEQNSLVALSLLVRDNAIQNFNVEVCERLSGTDQRRADPVKTARKDARLSYRQAVVDAAGQVPRCGSLGAIIKLQAIRNERKSRWKDGEPRLERTLQNEEAGIVMAGFGIQDPVAAQKVDVRKVLRLFGEESPWSSNQYARDRHPDWAKVEAEKTDKCVVLLAKLQDLKAGRIDAEDLSAALTRNVPFGEAFKALASSDEDFQAIGRKIERLKTAREKIRNKGGNAERAKVQQEGLELLRELLEPLGVSYGKKTVKGRQVTDNTKPIVPAGLDLSEMILMLERQAVRLRALPQGQKEPVVAAWDEPVLGEPPMPRQVCENCVYFHQNACCLGNPTDWQSSPVDAVGRKCGAFKRIKIELMLH